MRAILVLLIILISGCGFEAHKATAENLCADKGGLYIIDAVLRFSKCKDGTVYNIKDLDEASNSIK